MPLTSQALLPGRRTTGHFSVTLAHYRISLGRWAVVSSFAGLVRIQSPQIVSERTPFPFMLLALTDHHFLA